MNAPHIKTTKTASAQHGINVLVHGQAGSGKTTLCGTCCAPHKTLILSAEAGLLSLADKDIPVIEITSIDALQQAYQWIKTTKPDYQWLCLDSISEIAEVVLAAEKQVSKDPRQAYGALLDRMTVLLKAFRDLAGYNILMTAKTERVKDEATGAMLYSPMMPGSKLGQSLPYIFDEVLYLKVDYDEDGHPTRMLQTSRDYSVDAKDRSGKLDLHELPNIAALAQKIMPPKKPDTVSGASGPQPPDTSKPAISDELIQVMLDEIENAPNMEKLQYAFKSATGSLGKSHPALARIKSAATARKQELQQEDAANNATAAEAA